MPGRMMAGFIEARCLPDSRARTGAECDDSGRLRTDMASYVLPVAGVPAAEP
jgi:hypothetical protein